MKWIQLIAPVVLVMIALTACEGRSQKALPPFGLPHQRAEKRANVIGSSAAEVTDSNPRDLHTVSHTQAVLFSVRGGAVSRKLVAATAGASILTMYGVACGLSPEEVLKGYGVAKTPLTTHMTLNASVLTCSVTFVIWCLAYTKASVNKAVGIAVIPYVLRSLHNILTQVPAKFGSSAVAEYIGLALSSLVAYATLTNAVYADNAVKGLGLAMLLHGFVLFCSPNTTTLATEVTQRPGALKHVSRNHGNNLMINGTFFTALAMGYDVFKAFAYCWFVAATGMGTMTFVTKDIPALAPEAVGATVAWVVICYTLATVMLS